MGPLRLKRFGLALSRACPIRIVPTFQRIAAGDAFQTEDPDITDAAVSALDFRATKGHTFRHGRLGFKSSKVAATEDGGPVATRRNGPSRPSRRLREVVHRGGTHSRNRAVAKALFYWVSEPSSGYGGEGVSQSPLKDKAFSTFLDQNPPFELPEKGDFAFDRSLSRPMVSHRQPCHQATGERQIAVAPLCILTVRLMCGFPLERMPRIIPLSTMWAPAPANARAHP